MGNEEAYKWQQAHRKDTDNENRGVCGVFCRPSPTLAFSECRRDVLLSLRKCLDAVRYREDSFHAEPLDKLCAALFLQGSAWQQR